jgi:hypothetical protein
MQTAPEKKNRRVCGGYMAHCANLNQRFPHGAKLLIT